MFTYSRLNGTTPMHQLRAVSSNLDENRHPIIAFLAPARSIPIGFSKPDALMLMASKDLKSHGHIETTQQVPFEHRDLIS
jgi:hypothetical protein